MNKLSKKMQVVGGVALLGLAGLGVAAGAVAGQGGANDDAAEAATLAQVKVSMADAIKKAESETGMTAAEATLDDESTSPTWEVTVGSGTGERTVMVDAVSGAVKSVAADDGQDGDKDGTEGNEANEGPEGNEGRG